MSHDKTHDRKPGRFWFLAVPLLLLPVVGLYGYFFYRVNNDSSFGIEPDYYAKGVAWDAHQAQELTNRNLGWITQLDLVAAQPGIVELRLALMDSSGVALQGAQVSVEAFANARSAQRLNQPFVADSTGYRALLPLDMPGIWEFRLSVKHGETVYTEILRRELDSALVGR